jgi:plastocyanin
LTRIGWTAGGAVCAALLLTGAGAAATARKPAPVQTIVIDSMAFSPATVKVKPGQTIEWVNKDMFEHTATARDHSFDLDLKPKARGRITAPRSGTVAYVCRFHPGMTGVIKVQP